MTRVGLKGHRLCLRRSFRSYDPQRDTWAPAPDTPAGEKASAENRNQYQREGKQTTHIQPPPYASHLHCPRAPSPEREKTTGPHLQYTEPSLSTAEKGVGGWSTCNQPHPLPTGAALTLRRCQDPFPSISVPSCPHVTPQSHTPREKGESFLSHEDGRKNQKSEGSNLSSATLGDLTQVS